MFCLRSGWWHQAGTQYAQPAADICILHEFGLYYICMRGVVPRPYGLYHFVQVGDTILTRKKHPCGAASFEVLRVGMDFRIRCTGCGREVMLPRAKIEKNIKKVIKPGTV